MPVKFESARKIILSLDDVEEGTSYGTPGFKVNGKLFARYRPELNSLVVQASFEERDEMIKEDPDTYFITDHYTNYEWVLVRLDKVDPAALKDLLGRARRSAASEKKKPPSRKRIPHR